MSAGGVVPNFLFASDLSRLKSFDMRITQSKRKPVVTKSLSAVVSAWSAGFKERWMFVVISAITKSSSDGSSGETTKAGRPLRKSNPKMAQ
jgi:hypothetical protein